MLGRTEFASIIVDYSNRRVFELVEGKTTEKLKESLSHIEGKENVQNVIVDLCDPFKNFAQEHFPNAKIIADKFHVLRLITPALIRKRYEITGTRSDQRARRLLTVSSHNSIIGNARLSGITWNAIPNSKNSTAGKKSSIASIEPKAYNVPAKPSP